MARGAAGRGKFKVRRGGGRQFSKNIGEPDAEGTATPDKWAARGDDDDSDESEDEEEDGKEEEEESEDEAPVASGAGAPELSREERRQLKKQAKQKKDEEQEPYLVNQNHTAAKHLSLADLDAPKEPNRREREQKEKADAKERWWKLHEQGKTDQAKADLARLGKIRAEREAAAAKRKAEADAKVADAEKKKAAAASGKRV